jgi:ABC-type uncharacterized transport system permease subunit
MNADGRYTYRQPRVRWVPAWAVAVAVALALVLTVVNLQQASHLVAGVQQHQATAAKAAEPTATRRVAHEHLPGALPLVFAGLVFLMVADPVRPYRYRRDF